MAADISAISYLAPVAVFIIVVAIVYAVLLKLKIFGEHKLGILFISFVIATIFISAAGAIRLVSTIVPTFVVLIISLAFLLIMLGFIGKIPDSLNSGIRITILVVFALVFLFTAFSIYSNVIIGYLPGPTFGYNVEPTTIPALQWLYSPRVAGAILLILASALASWILTKAK